MLSINNLTQKIATKVLCRLRSAVVKVDQGGHVDVQSHFTKAGTKIKRVGMDSTEWFGGLSSKKLRIFLWKSCEFFMSCKYPIYGVQLILIQK